jgi:hypothetical protein
VLILKIILKKIKKYYFNIFLNVLDSLTMGCVPLYEDV